MSARQQRRRENLAAAVWRVLDRAGFAGLSMRAVARRCASTGVVTHHFSSKRELTTFALDLLAECSAADPGGGDLCTVRNILALAGIDHRVNIP